MNYSFTRLKSLLAAMPVFILSCTTAPSTTETYYTEADFQKVDKADVHIHIFTESNDFVEQAAKDKFKVVSIALDASNDWANVREEFRYCLFQAKKNPSTVEAATAFSMEGWDEPDWLDKSMDWLDSTINSGAIAVKIWKNIGMVYRDKQSNLIMIDNPRFDPIFKMLAERKIPVIGHLGEPKNCWLPLEEMTTNNDRNYFKENPQYHMFQHPDLPSYEQQIQARDNMLAKNPDLTFVGAHMGSLEWDVDMLAKTLDRFPNMSVDLAARMGQVFYQTHFNREKVREFFIKYQDRVLYATDMGASPGQDKEALRKEMHETWTRDWRYFVTGDTMKSNLVNHEFQGLKLPQQVVDKIFYQNAVKWLKAFEGKNG
jgi:predicted TIM-barrel fold metal-dependent hydrolase